MNKHRLKMSNEYRFEQSLRPRYRTAYKNRLIVVKTTGILVGAGAFIASFMFKRYTNGSQIAAETLQAITRKKKEMRKHFKSRTIPHP